MMIVVRRSTSSRRQLALVCYAFALVLTGHICVHTYVISSALIDEVLCNETTINNNNNNNNNSTFSSHNRNATKIHHPNFKGYLPNVLMGNRIISENKQAVVRLGNRTGNETVISEYLAAHERRCEWLLVKHVDDFNNKEFCACIPPTLVQRIKVTEDNQSLAAIESVNTDVQYGGHWEPTSCLPRMRVAVIVPFRDRKSHLHVLLHHLHRVLQGQLLHYVIIVIEQGSPVTFNKAVLMNVGYLHVISSFQPDCVVFHDVDMIPEDGRHMYYCQDQPLHLGAHHSRHHYRVLYPRMFGGVVALRPAVFEAVNGFSNSFWGWGGEDDDLSYRLSGKGFRIVRNPRPVSEYMTLRHRRDTGNQQNDRRSMLRKLLKDFDPKNDGLKSVVYRLRTQRRFLLYTWLHVDIPTGNNTT